MIALSQPRTKDLLAIHGWSGVFLGLLLYAVILTGVVSVFAHEIGEWSAPLPHATHELPAQGLDAAIRKASAEVPAEFHEDLFFFSDTAGRIRAFFHKDDHRNGQPEARGVEFDIDPVTLKVLDRREGWADDIRDHNVPSALADFFVELHVSLHLPNPWGLLVTGILGLAMLVAAVTGFLVHRHLIRELFTLRKKKDPLLVKRDAHVIAGTWNLPFAFVLAFTGSYFSFAGAFTIPAVAMVAFGGDQEKLIETVVGVTVPEDKTPATFGNLDAMLADARSRSGAEPGFVTVEHYGRADAHVTVSMLPPEGKLAGATFIYDGDSGAFVQQKPTLGLVPSIGNDLFVLMGPLHFGNFAGLWSKAVWFALGFAGAYVTLTGMLLWTTRRQEQPGWGKLARAAHWMGYGLPLALATVPLARFAAPLLDVDVRALQNGTFIAAVVLASGIALRVRNLDSLRRVLLAGTGIALLVAPLLRWISGGPGWITAFENGLATVIALDLAVLLAGALCLLAARRAPAVMPVSHTTLSDEAHA
ncbi:MAG: PepSY-associated TM helix domain-containing protein [Stagnimonas sp.]|nr:PepSY-associated TM helix domain-containing protein [Stagnimonas sp.]